MNETKGLWLARFVLIAGVVASFLLLTQSPSELVFWSGDGGLKHMMAKQFAEGRFHVDLRLTDDPSVAKLWADGLHPGVRDGYIFDRGGKYFAVFPYPFSLISAPFYALFGVPGYYIVPMLSTWGLCFILYLTLRRTCIEPWVIALLMAAFIFATPIMLYATAFWEHTLGMFLAFAPVAYTLRHEDSEPGKITPIIAGATLGLAVWIRPEMMALMAALLPAAFVWRRRALGFRGWFLFSAAAIAMVVCFFLANQLIYGHPLGTHGLQVFSIYPPPTRADIVWDRFVFITRAFVRYAPVVVFMAGLLGLMIWKRCIAWRGEAVYLIVVTGLFYLLMIYMVPSKGDFQIGPRFALLVMALIIPVCAYAWKSLWPMPNALRMACVGVLLFTIAVGARRNVVQESQWVIGQYRNRVLPAYTFVASRDEPVVAVSHVKLTAELCGLMDSKIFFAAIDDQRFNQLLAGLRERGIDNFLYIAEGDEQSEYDSPIKHDVAKTLDVEPLGRYGAHFYCYAVSLPPAP
ncbi:MAG: hypothetical protein SGI88_06340 [Candidatus Hydrogenedentes bacterium]|nr:hypothetical protein [Candidatus Hydrogenedentota bacterium]